MPATLDDRVAVRALLGRDPAAEFEVVVRAGDGTPVVIRNLPFTNDGTPMPTRYWLVGPEWNRAVSRLEAAGRQDPSVDERLGHQTVSVILLRCGGRSGLSPRASASALAIA